MEATLSSDQKFHFDTEYGARCSYRHISRLAMEGPEPQLRAAATRLWEAFQHSQTGSCETIHPDCVVLIVHDANGTFTTGKHTTIQWPDAMLACDLEIQFIKAGKQSSSCIQIKIGREFAGFFVFLQEKDGDAMIWKCISVAVGVSNNGQILPSSYEQINLLTWDGYCHANRICDGNLMSQYFHRTCRLTYTDQDDRITICESKAFCEKVTGRYENEDPHKPYRHLKNDPRLGDANTLLSIEFATPQLAMVKLKVGHPPFLWTDLLTCARITENEKIQWWIVHKSSDNESHPLC